MPKFLDTPSWYDQNGQLVVPTTFTMTGMGGVNYVLKTGGQGSLTKVAVFSSQGDPGSIAYASAGGYPVWNDSGVAGQVLTSDGSNSPKWSGLYVHNVYIYGTGAGGVAAYAYMTVVSSDSEEYTTAAQVYAKFSGYQHTVMTTGKIASESTYGVIVGSFLSNNDIGMRYIKIDTPNGGASSIYITPSSISDKVCSIT